MKQYIEANKTSSGAYQLRFSNGALMGTAEQEVDGYYYFYPDQTKRGFWAPFILRAIADKVDEINKPWNDMIEKDLAAFKQLGFWDIDPTTSKFDDDERE